MNWRWIKRRQTEVYYMQPIRLSCLTSVEESVGYNSNVLMPREIVPKNIWLYVCLNDMLPIITHCRPSITPLHLYVLRSKPLQSASGIARTASSNAYGTTEEPGATSITLSITAHSPPHTSPTTHSMCTEAAQEIHCPKCTYTILRKLKRLSPHHPQHASTPSQQTSSLPSRWHPSHYSWAPITCIQRIYVETWWTWHKSIHEQKLWVTNT